MYEVVLGTGELLILIVSPVLLFGLLGAFLFWVQSWVTTPDLRRLIRILAVVAVVTAIGMPIVAAVSRQYPLRQGVDSRSMEQIIRTNEALGDGTTRRGPFTTFACSAHGCDVIERPRRTAKSHDRVITAAGRAT